MSNLYNGWILCSIPCYCSLILTAFILTQDSEESQKIYNYIEWLYTSGSDSNLWTSVLLLASWFKLLDIIFEQCIIIKCLLRPKQQNQWSLISNLSHNRKIELYFYLNRIIRLQLYGNACPSHLLISVNYQLLNSLFPSSFLQYMITLMV